MKKAIFTLQHNEEWYLPMWIKYYSQFFAPKDMFILSHNCTGKTKEILEQAEKDGINVHWKETDSIFQHEWLLNEVHTAQHNLLQAYDYVVFTDCDELIVPTDCDLGTFIDNATEEAYRCVGIDVIEDKMYLSGGFNKTLISRIPLTWCHGYHFSVPEFPVDGRLHLYHIKKMNFWKSWERNILLSKENWDKTALDQKLGFQNYVSDQKDFREMFYGTGELTKQDEQCKALLDYIQ